ncbi:BppU family phage baseplate upper protein [Mammaliicoccus sciuri]|uniref:BppU family phage baseplate upper protein n=1 Tax=Mammaliicoccus sciuri TaxID=1296 RepID=UPI0030CBA507
MSLKKLANLTLETSAEYKPRSDLNIAFSSADRDTATFRFKVTQGNKPLLLGEENIKSSIKLIHSNGSKITQRLTIADGLNGLLEVVLPNELVKMPGKVTAQVYVTRQSDEVETQAVVAERIFSFTIQESLAWEFDGEVKLNYIIEFDELEAQLNERVIAIEEAIANGEDYVAQMKDALQEGLTTISAKVSNATTVIQDLKTSTITQVTNLKNTAISTIQTELQTGKSEAEQIYNDLIESIQNNEVVNQEELQNAISLLATNDSVETKTNALRDYTNGQLDLKDNITSVDNKIATAKTEMETFSNNKFSDTGWVPFDTINGVKKDTKLLSSGAFKCAYRKITINGMETCSLRINVENFTNDMQIAQLPADFTTTMQPFYLRSSTNKAPVSGYITPTGVVKLNIPDSERANWTSSDYALGSTKWDN